MCTIYFLRLFWCLPDCPHLWRPHVELASVDQLFWLFTHSVCGTLPSRSFIFVAWFWTAGNDTKVHKMRVGGGQTWWISCYTERQLMPCSANEKAMEWNLYPMPSASLRMMRFLWWKENNWCILNPNGMARLICAVLDARSLETFRRLPVGWRTLRAL